MMRAKINDHFTYISSFNVYFRHIFHDTIDERGDETMMTITRITTQKKNNNRYNIYVDDGGGETYGFSVDEAVLIEYRLRKGLEMSEAMVSELTEKDSFYQSYALAIRYLGYRMRTKKEVADYLQKKDVSPHNISATIDRLTTNGLLDDEQFANAFVQTRINTSSKGPLLIEQELLKKGVSRGQCTRALQRYDDSIQYEKALKWVQKKIHSRKKESYRKKEQRLQAALIRKGFTQDVVQDVLDAVQMTKNDEEQREALIYHGEKLRRKYERKFTKQTLANKLKEGLYRRGFTLEEINEYINCLIEKDL